jgi:pilus assembly protein FimV
MSLRYVVRALVLAGLMPAAAMALGLGDIHLKSTLNSPLSAEIDLSTNAEELGSLKVALANRDSFARYGLDYPAYLDTVTIVVGKSADGRDVLTVRSRDVVAEPFATLLIEANWARGRLVREYTVLLDPPAFTSDKASAAAAVAGPVAAPQAQSGGVERPATPPAPEAGQPPAGATAAAPSATPGATPGAAPGARPGVPSEPTPGTYVVQRGDTLSAIAARNYPNSQRERALVALFKANPSAFDGNMNQLHAGAALQVPDGATVAAIGPGEASAEVGSQYRAWAGTHGGGGQLHLVPPSEPSTGAARGAGGAASGETAALQQRVQTLQAQLAESQRLLDLKNAELARLQAQLGRGKPGVTAPAPPPAAAAKPSAAPSAAPSPQEVLKNPPQETPAPVPEATPLAVSPAPVAAPKPKPAPAAKHAPAQPAGSSGGMLEWLLSNWYLLVAGIAAVLAGLFGWRYLSSRKEQEFGSTLDRLSSPPLEAPTRAALRPTETQPMRALGSKEDTSFVVEESGSHQAPRISDSELAAVQSGPVAVDETVSGDTAVALDQGDPLAEADFHMAYGLYDQAADLVRIAIAREPQRRDLKLKLLEVFFVWGNKDQFLQLARELSASRDQALAGEWEKVVIMGRQIAPDDALFAAAGALPGAASGGVDLNLEGGQNRVDFDLLGEPSIAAEPAADGVDLDLGAALRDADAPTGEQRSIGDTGVDFVLDDPARGGDATGSTREMPQSHTVTLDTGDQGADSPTVENLQPPHAGGATIRQKLEASGQHPGPGTEQTAELALDDLGLDVSAGETGMHRMTEAGSAPTMLTSLDADTRELFAQAEVVTPDTAEIPATASSPSGTWLFSDKDFSQVMPSVKPGAEAPTELVTAVMPAATETFPGITSELASLKSKGAAAEVDLNLNGLGATAARPAARLDLDVGHSKPAADTAFTATQRLVSPAPMNEAEPATMSEVGTKLDLARAYMDMGDPEGARSILDEVLAEGSASQKTEARRLIDSLPG